MNTVYPLARQRLLERVIAGADLPAATFKVALVSNSYVYDSSHEFFEDIEDFVLGTTPDLENVTTNNGVLRADQVLIEGLTPGNTVKAVVVYATWTGGTLLFSYQESATDSSLPALISAEGGIIFWDAAGIFRF